jgi:tetratricopeptide (TPR) repeat protein
MLCALIGTSALTIGVSLGYLLGSLQVVALPPAAATTYTSTEGLVLKAQLDYYEKRVDDLQRLASAMLLFSTLFTAVAGITTYINVSQSVEKTSALVQDAKEQLAVSKTQAEGALQKLDSELAQLKERAKSEMEEIRKEFPMFGYMNHLITRILHELTAVLDPDFLLPGIDRNQVFSQLSPEKRQRILFYEKTVAALSMVDLREYASQVGKIYRGLGIFFGSKAYGSVGVVDDDDLEKALFYFGQANKVDSENSATLNEMGYFIINEKKPSSLSRAEQIFRRSIDLLDNQQRARMNLGYIYILRKEYVQANAVLAEALQKTSWETGRDAPHLQDINYNYACSLAGSMQLDKAIVHLEAAFEDFRKDWWETLRLNLSDPEDTLQRLAQTEPYKQRVQALVERGERTFGSSRTEGPKASG